METTTSSAAFVSVDTADAHARTYERRIGRFVVAAIVVFTLWQCAYGFRWPESRVTTAVVFESLIYGTAAAAELIALLLAWRSTAASGSFALAVFLSLLGNGMTHLSVYRWAVNARLPAAVVGTFDLILPASFLYMTAAVVRFSAMFPDALTPAEFPPRAVFRRLRVALLRPRVVWLSATAVFALAVVVTYARPSVIRIVRPPMTAAILLALVVAVSNMRINYRNASAEGKRRIFWVVEGFLGAVGLVVIASLVKVVQMVGGRESGPWYPLSMLAAFIILIVCLTIAMFFSGALDPALAIKRTAVYGLLGITLVFVFVAVENTVQDYLKAWLHLSDSASGVIVGGVVALSAEPIKERLSAVAERVLGRWGIAPASRAHRHHERS